ncbi:hypothetical protein PICSAR38_04509 [Mycobacterium avium subsp. paratuberculosis]|nr:hypothetical protein PICSAR38_04509 [Mycobacterium avium subsp. paratuberculosis]
MTLLADEVASSVDEHVRFGGVVPEIASRAHLASQRPPMPTSTTATSTGASANAANAIAVSTSNLLIAGPPAACDC